MGTKEHIELAGLELGMNLFALGRRCRTRQERPGHTGLREQGAGLIGILTCQHARGCHNAGLGAAIGSHGQRTGGNSGFTGTDVAQQQTVHHAAAIAHVIQDVLECSLLLITQRKRQGLFKRGQALARNVRIRHHIDQAAIVAKTQRELQVETFLVGKTPTRDIALSHARGKVNRAQRTGIAHEATLDAQRRGNGIEGIGDHFERAAYDTAHPGLTHAVTYVVDRENGAGSTPVLELFKMR